MAKRKDILNLGDEYNEVKPFDQRESIAFLLGAGFSIPMGYPTRTTMIENSAYAKI